MKGFQVSVLDVQCPALACRLSFRSGVWDLSCIVESPQALGATYAGFYPKCGHGLELRLPRERTCRPQICFPSSGRFLFGGARRPLLSSNLAPCIRSRKLAQDRRKLPACRVYF